MHQADLKREDAQEVIDSFLCTHGTLELAWRTQKLKSPPALLTRSWVAQEIGMRPPATVNCGINCPREKFLPDPQGSVLIQEDL